MMPSANTTPNEPESADCMHLSTKAMVMEEQGDLEKSAALHLQAVTEFEQDPRVHAGFVSHYIRCHLKTVLEDVNIYNAVTKSLDVLQNKQTNEELLDQLWLEIAVFYQYSGDVEKATLAFTKAVETNPAVETYYNYANFLDQIIGNSELAGEMYQKVLSLSPEHVLSLNNYSASLIEQARSMDKPLGDEKRARAIELLLRAQNIAPGFPAYNLACAFAMSGNEEECRKWLEVTLSLQVLSVDDIMEDDDLATVRECPWFVSLLSGETTDGVQVQVSGEQTSNAENPTPNLANIQQVKDASTPKTVEEESSKELSVTQAELEKVSIEPKEVEESTK